MAQDTIEFPAAQRMTTASLVIAILESRRAYQRALALARRLLREGAPTALTWGDDVESPVAVAAPTSSHVLIRTMRQRGYPAFHAGGVRGGRHNRHGIRIVPPASSACVENSGSE